MRRTGIPIMIFVIGQLASTAILVLWIVWHASSHSGAWWIIQGILLMIPVMGGTTIIFVYWTKSRVLDAERVNFISTVSHELLTPLASLQMYIETLQLREVNDEKRKEFINLMRTDTERLSSSIAQILTASRLERSKTEYRFLPDSLADVVRDFISENPVLLQGADIRTDLLEGLYCRIDRDSFYSVLRNLFENAIRYSKGTPRVSVTLDRFGKKAKLTVSDNGEGLSPKEQKKIFNIFYRASKLQVGTGLGLYIVRKFVKGHGGKVWAESAGKGRGASFHILLPTVDKPE